MNPVKSKKCAALLLAALILFPVAVMGASAQAQAPQAVPGYREIPLLVILVEFPDAPILHEDRWGPSIFGTEEGTVRDYYLETTMGKWEFVPPKDSYGTANDGVVKVNLTGAEPHYWGNAAITSSSG